MQFDTKMDIFANIRVKHQRMKNAKPSKHYVSPPLSLPYTFFYIFKPFWVVANLYFV